MMVKSSAKVLGLLAFAIMVCLAYFLGVVSFLINLEENKCDMTYMYEYPHYTVSLVHHQILSFLTGE